MWAATIEQVTKNPIAALSVLGNAVCDRTNATEPKTYRCAFDWGAAIRQEVLASAVGAEHFVLLACRLRRAVEQVGLASAIRAADTITQQQSITTTLSMLCEFFGDTSGSGSAVLV